MGPASSSRAVLQTGQVLPGIEEACSKALLAIPSSPGAAEPLDSLAAPWGIGADISCMSLCLVIVGLERAAPFRWCRRRDRSAAPRHCVRNKVGLWATSRRMASRLPHCQPVSAEGGEGPQERADRYLAAYSPVRYAPGDHLGYHPVLLPVPAVAPSQQEPFLPFPDGKVRPGHARTSEWARLQVSTQIKSNPEALAQIKVGRPASGDHGYTRGTRLPSRGRRARSSFHERFFPLFVAHPCRARQPGCSSRQVLRG